MNEVNHGKKMHDKTLSDERRREPRRKLNLPAFVRARLNDLKISCVVEDISNSGAKIRLPDPDRLPDDFVLCLDGNATVIRICKVVWREGTSLGVQFSRST